MGKLKGAQGVENQIVETVAAAAGSASQAKAAGSIFGIKILNFVLAVFSFAILCMVFIVMAMTRPASHRETVAALISTCISCVGVGGFVVLKLGMIQAAAAAAAGGNEFEVLAHIFVMASVFFAGGAPGWVTTRSVFLWIDKSKNKTFVEMWKELREAFFK